MYRWRHGAAQDRHPADRARFGRARAPARRPRCAPEGCGSAAAVGERRSPASSCPTTRSSRSRRLRRYVSRGGLKLERALDVLGVDVEGRSCLDVGASTGGFTDCLLQRGAARVIALDVGYGQLDWRLRNDPRVQVMERKNARELSPADLPYEPELGDDRRLVHLAGQGAARGGRLPGPGGEVLALVKPQFELGRGPGQGRGGALGGRPARGADVRGRGRSGARPRGPGLRLVRASGAEGQPRDLHLVRHPAALASRTWRPRSREVEP